MKFRNLFIPLCIFTAFLYGDVFAQSLNLSINCGFSSNSIMQFTRLDGGGGYTGKGSWHSGISITGKMKKNFRLKTGIIYARHLIEITPEYFPNVEIEIKNTNVRLLSLPIEVRWEFLNYFFLESGPSVDFDISNGTNPVDSQSGIGWNAGLGAGINYRKLHFELNPSIKLHSLVAFKPEKYQQHLSEAGFNLGIGYVF